MNKTPKSKAESSWSFAKEIRKERAVRRAERRNRPAPEAIKAISDQNIITRMEATQQRFGRFAPSGRLQLTDREAEAAFDESCRMFDGEDADDWQEQSERQGAE